MKIKDVEVGMKVRVVHNGKVGKVSGKAAGRSIWVTFPDNDERPYDGFELEPVDEIDSAGRCADFESIGQNIGKLVADKNAAYGDSFAKAGSFLRLLYPEGIPVEKYDDMLCLVRVFDKQMRIATQKDAFGESPWQDIAGYAILEIKREKCAQ